MKIEEKLMTIQTLGKLLEAQRTIVKTDLEGKPTTPPYPAPVLDTSDRLVVQAKIVEFVKSLRAFDLDGNHLAEALLQEGAPVPFPTNGSI